MGEGGLCFISVIYSSHKYYRFIFVAVISTKRILVLYQCYACREDIKQRLNKYLRLEERSYDPEKNHSISYISRNYLLYHYTLVFWPVWNVVLFLNRQCVDVSAKGDNSAGRVLSLNQTDNPCFGHYLVRNAVFFESLPDKFGCFMFLVA